MSLGGGDKLASGQSKAQFAAGSSTYDAPIELHNVAPEEEGFKEPTVVDKRRSYDSEPVEHPEPKYPPKEYLPFTPILDRVLVKRIPEDPNFELLEDGSMRDKRSGFVIPGKYRQHSCTGIVLSTGDFVVLGGLKIPMSYVVKPGCKATWGDYNSEIAKLPESTVQELCDSVEMNYEPDEDGVRIVRIQDIRGVEWPVGLKKLSWFKALYIGLRGLFNV
jgi:hypothetical protein